MRSTFSNRDNHVRNQAGTQNVTGDLIAGDVHHYYANTQRDGRLQEEARQKILASLYHPQMDTRKRQIDDRPACEGTFEWILQDILDRSEAQEYAWNSFVHWLQSSDTSTPYWISGKPGSGKSTLMRFLEKRIVQLMRDDSRGDIWTNDASILLISHYFWASGADDQKSVLFLLQYLLYRLLDARHDLIVTVVSRERYRMALHSSSSSAWAYHELRDAIVMFVQQCGPSDKIFVHVDALDEHEGDDEGRWELLKFFGTLASSGRVKVCLSSRPWTVYEDWFKDHPRIRLEDLTANDIKIFVHSRLETDSHISRLMCRDFRLTDRLTREILEAAQGVFLWVHLAVRDLKKGARDGGDADRLFCLLGGIPRDMDRYLRRLIESIPSEYRREASIMLQIALYDMKLDTSLYRDSPHDFFYSIPELSLLHFTYLNSTASPNFATQDDFVPFGCVRSGIVSEDRDVRLAGHNYNTDADPILDEKAGSQLDNARRRVSTRCLDLLEVVGTTQVKKRVVFLHRTVRDFLKQKEQDNLLISYSGTRYDAKLFRCNTLLADIQSLVSGGPVDTDELHRFSLQLELLFHQIISEATVVPSYQRLFEQLLQLISTKPFINTFRNTTQDSTNCELCREATCEQIERSATPLNMAIRVAWHAYVKAHLSEIELICNKPNQRPLLDCALRPSSSFSILPSPGMVHQLLAFGVCPNQNYGDVSIWAHFIVSIVFLIRPYNLESATQKLLEILKTLLRSGARLHLTGRDILLATNAVHNSMFHNLYYSGGRTERVMQAVSMTEIREDLCYSVIDLIRSVVKVDREDTRGNLQLTDVSSPVFDKEAMEKLGKAQQEGMEGLFQLGKCPSITCCLSNTDSCKLPVSVVLRDSRLWIGPGVEIIRSIRGYWPFFVTPSSDVFGSDFDVDEEKDDDEEDNFQPTFQVRDTSTQAWLSTVLN